MESLSEIGSKYNADKGDALHTFNGLSYLDIYDKYFSSIRHDKINFLEIGVHGGASLRMWKDYFPFGNIYGLDINPDCKRCEEERIIIEIGSQIDKAAIDKLCEQVEKFDIIIDDSSHLNKYTIQSFKLLFDHLSSGGWYVIEDLKMSYIDLTTFVNKWPGMAYNKGLDAVNKREDMNNFLFDLIKKLDHASGDVLTIHFWAMICFIQKTINP